MTKKSAEPEAVPAVDGTPADVATDGDRFFSKRVLSWAFWDWGSAAFNAVTTTFVFTIYITSKPFGPDATSLIGWVLGIAGLLIAVLAPVIGQAADRSGKRRTQVTITTLVVVTAMALLSFVKPSESYLWFGLITLACGHIFFEIGSVTYNTMLADVTSPRNFGRISGFGWGMGYVGGIVLLLIVYTGFISPEVGWFGVTHEDGMNVRVTMIVCALWTLLFSLPLFLTARNHPPRHSTTTGVVGAYKALFKSVIHIWREKRTVAYFLLASAIYRDGLAGVFTFGGVLAAQSFGFAPGEVIIFGVAANLVAGVATIAFGWLDDHWGASTVILMSLVTMVTSGAIIFFFHSGGKVVFWVFGLLLSVSVGPTQSASRSYLARIAPKGYEGEVFGLYATTGRAVSFLAPLAYSTAISIGAFFLGVTDREATYFGILGLIAVLVVGLALFIPVRRHARATTSLHGMPL